MAGIPTGLVALGLGVANSSFGSNSQLSADSNANLQANSFTPSYTSTATAAGTTTLTAASTQLQKFTGTTTQTVLLPVVSTLSIGHTFEFNNQSTGSVTIESSGGNILVVLAPEAFATINSNSTTGTTDASWDLAQYGVGNTPIVRPIAAVMSVSGLTFAAGDVVWAEGRATAYDGGGGFFRFSSSSSLTVDNGLVFSAPGGKLIRDVVTTNSSNQLAGALNVRWFGAIGDGATDDTAAILAAYTALQSSQIFFALLFPMGRYVTFTQFIFNDVATCVFIMEGATFIGASSGSDNSQPALFEIQNCSSFAIAGSWWVTAIPQSGPTSGNPNAYMRGLYIHGAPGGVLAPTLGVASYVDVEGLVATRIGNGISIGDVNNDAPTSEIVLRGCKTPQCVNPIAVAGSQTLVTAIGCELTSSLVTGITNSPHYAIVNNGGAISVIGGSVEQHADAGTAMVIMEPAQSTTYGNPYGQVSIEGATIETIAPLVEIVNQFAVASPSSYLSLFSISNSIGGYLGGIAGNEACAYVYDTTYAGEISIPDGQKFYAQLASAARTAPNIDATGNTTVQLNIGKNVFDTTTGFEGWPHGVVGGILIQPMTLATSATVISQSVGTSLTTVIWGSNPADPVRTGRNQAIVNTTTGEITVPAAGVRFIQIAASVVLSLGTVTGTIALYRNGSVYRYGVLNNSIGNIDVTVPDPVVGDVFTIRLQLSAAVTLASNSSLSVFLETS